MKKKALFFSTFPLLALLAVSLALPLAASAATSSHVHLLGTRQNAHPNSGGNLIYHGGPIMPNTSKDYVIFWEPTGSFVSSTFNSLVLRYFGDIGGSSLYHNNIQYKDSGGNKPTGSVLGGSWKDTAAYPSNPLSDNQVQHEVTHAISVNGWNASITNIFFVFTAKGENICASFGCSFQQFCAYHGAFGSSSIYAAMPYLGTNLAVCSNLTKSPNHDFDADSELSTTSHEQIEAATDPHLSAWYDAQGSEIGDKCAYTYGKIGADGSNVHFNGHPYILQREWDNAKHTCVVAGP